MSKNRKEENGRQLTEQQLKDVYGVKYDDTMNFNTQVNAWGKTRDDVMKHADLIILKRQYEANKLIIEEYYGI